ncbi:MAG: L7Ae/L30e/S12e/Gadd45 family ribosomal protein, partial [Nitrospinota bacterium]
GALKGKRLERAFRRKPSVPDAATLVRTLEGQLSQKVLSLLGMARRAGRLALGWRAAEDALKKERAALLLAVGDPPEGKLKALRGLAERGGVPFAFLGGEERLWEALGRNGVRFLALTDRGMAEAILLRLGQRERLSGTEKTPPCQRA